MSCNEKIFKLWTKLNIYFKNVKSNYINIHIWLVIIESKISLMDSIWSKVSVYTVVCNEQLHIIIKL